ncbi:hypothetical protein ACLOJK_027634 [Asimina triloba]
MGAWIVVVDRVVELSSDRLQWIWHGAAGWVSGHRCATAALPSWSLTCLAVMEPHLPRRSASPSTESRQLPHSSADQRHCGDRRRPKLLPLPCYRRWGQRCRAARRLLAAAPHLPLEKMSLGKMEH